MKAFLYAGAVLMTGASIYGFIDYKKSTHNKDFTNLYKSDDQAVVTETKQPVADSKTSLVGNEKIAEVKKNSEVVKTVYPVTTTKEKTVTNMTMNPVDPVKTEAISNVTVTPKPTSIKKKKVLSYKLFSRGALEEKYINKELKLDEPKKDQQ